MKMLSAKFFGYRCLDDAKLIPKLSSTYTLQQFFIHTVTVKNGDIARRFKHYRANTRQIESIGLAQLCGQVIFGNTGRT